MKKLIVRYCNSYTFRLTWKTVGHILQRRTAP